MPKSQFYEERKKMLILTLGNTGLVAEIEKEVSVIINKHRNIRGDIQVDNLDVIMEIVLMVATKIIRFKRDEKTKAETGAAIESSEGKFYETAL